MSAPDRKPSDGIPGFIRMLLWFAGCFLVAILIGMWLSDARAQSIFDAPPYWHRVPGEPVPVRATFYLDQVICGTREAWGCADLEARVILVSKRAPAVLWDCIVEHEKMHFARWTHEDGALDVARGNIIWCDLTHFASVPPSWK